MTVSWSSVSATGDRDPRFLTRSRCRKFVTAKNICRDCSYGVNGNSNSGSGSCDSCLSRNFAVEAPRATTKKMRPAITSRLFLTTVFLAQLIAVSSQDELESQERGFNHAAFCAGSIKGIDGKLLGAYSWVIPKPTSSAEVSLFYLSLCEPLNFTKNSGDSFQLQPVECNGAFVCHVTRFAANKSYTAEVLVKATEGNQSFEAKRNYVFLTGGPCKHQARKNIQVVISFQCGFHLGSPHYMLDNSCNMILSWRTSAACFEGANSGAPPSTGSRTPLPAAASPSSGGLPPIIKPNVQVPCYVIDEFTGHKYDLSHLIRLRGTHKVEASNVDLYINICQDITDSLIGCTTPGTAACLNLRKSSWKTVGLINSSTRVQLIKETGDLTITYKPSKNSKPFENCVNHPSTVIHLRCPEKRGRNRPPRLLANISCQYMIEWETDHACPEHSIVGDVNSCKIDIDGNQLDLGRLRGPKGLDRVSNVTIFGKQHDVLLSICSFGLKNGICGKISSTMTTNVCFNDSDGNAYSLGSKTDSGLRYTDGRATLVYFNGNPCTNSSDSNRRWSSAIEFVCDSETTSGAPELASVDTDVCIIRFEWKTAAACIPDVVTGDENVDYSELQESCHYTSGDFHMDLSALDQKTGSWFVMDDGEHFEFNLYVEVCSPVQRLGHLTRCPVRSAVCGLPRDDSTPVSFGQYSTVMLLQNASSPVGVLEFSDGDQCKSKPEKQYKTLIHLACTPGQHGASPRFFAFDKERCELHLEWHTSVACPQVSLTNTTCMVEDLTHGFRIDLTPLARYGVQHISSGDFEYDIAVCGPLPSTYSCGSDSNAAVCRRNLTDKGDVTPLGAASSDLIYNGGMITVVYADKAESSNIAFQCDFDAGIGKPQVLSSQPGNTVFNWATSFACPAMNAHYQSCVVQATDKSGHLYDLSRLTRVRPNRDWTFLTTDIGELKLPHRFYVSLCRPLYQPPARCNPHAAVCVETIYPNGTTKFVDAGHVVDPPSANSRGELTLTYSNGAPCIRRGQPSTMRTTIHFQCDDEVVPSGEYLRYINKPDQCEYLLLWTTEAACPIRHQPVKDECAIVDRLTGDLFNISHMRADTFYRKGDYEFNICGPIRNSTNCLGENISVCRVTTDQTGRTKGVPLTGATGYQLDFVGVGSLRLSYMGEITSGRTTRVEIELVCTTALLPKNSVIEARGSLGDDQVHRINFYSSGVCPNYRTDPTNCEIINSETGYAYDLRPLVHTALSNWEASEYSPISYDYQHLASPEQKYHFNICKKLNTVPLSDGGYNCPRGSYACATYTNDNSRMGESLGRHMDDIVFGEDGTIGIRYVGGDKCPPEENRDGEFQAGNGTQGETNPKFKSSLITLACTPNAHEMPKIIRTSKDCEYVFYMETPAACPVKKAVGSDCKVTEPNFGYRFDLSALGGKSKVYTVNNPDDKGMHKMTVCGALPDAGVLCGGDNEAGSCLIGANGKNISLGKGTATLQYNTGILTLIYTNGVVGCTDSKKNRSTTINFHCDHSAKVGSTAPEFQSMDGNCGFVFSWYTELACPPRTEQVCKVDTPDGLVDLSPLSAPRRNYVTPDNMIEVGQKYVVNVCRSVVHMRALACEFSSGACIINGDKTVNLGVVSRGPFYVKDERIVRIQYQNGDLCTTKSTLSSQNRWSTTIDFVCQSKDSGPVHVSNDNCKAIFFWNTPHACPQSHDLQPAKNHTCAAVHPSAGGLVIDLLPLVRSDNESPYAVPGPAGSTYKLNICGSARETSCGPHTGICLESRTESAKIVARPSSHLIWENGVLAMVFEGGQSCGLANEDHLRKMKAIIHFVCPSAGFGRDAPMFVSQSPDDCEHRFVWPTELVCPNILQCAYYQDQEFDLSPLSTRSHRARNVLDTGYEYYLSVCRPLEPQQPYLSMPPNAAIVRVAVNSKSKVESLGHTFFGSFTHFQHSVTLLYVNGSRCEWDNTQLYKARISFECDYSQDAGEPVLVDIDQAECLHVFRWRTNLVCAGSADTHQINPRGNCSFPVPQRGITLDLSSLAKKSPHQIRVNSPDGEESGYFTMSVCKDMSASISGCKNSELCFASKVQGGIKNISYGVAESYHYQGGSLFVRYTTGDKCVSMLGKTYGAIVEFECDPLYDTGSPVVERQYGCLTVFRWKTVKACSPQQLQAAEGHDCIVRRGASTFDLTMLSSVSHAWKLEDPQSRSTFYLNICGINHKWPLDAIDKCSKSGVCVEKKTNDNKDEFQSLGEYSSREVVVEDSSTIRITYNGGDPSVCPLNEQHPKSIIVIKCDLDGDSIGSLKFVSGPTSKSCTYKFEWPTRYACPEATDVLVMQKGGYLIDPAMHQAYNLTALFNRTFRTFEYRLGQDNYTYLVNLREVCTESSCRIPWRMGPCAQSAVCQAKRSTFMKNIGSANKQRFYLRGFELLLVIDTLATCLHVPNSTIKSIFTFACDHEAGIGVPSFLYETKSCHYIFSWPTEYVCPSRVEHPTMAWSHMGTGEANGDGSPMGIVIILSALAVTLAGVFMFLSKPDNRMAVRARVLRIFRTVTMPHYYYSKTESEMQSPLDTDGDTVLLSPSLVLQPDDDDFSSPLA